MISKLGVRTLKAQLAQHQYLCATLANEFEVPTLTAGQRAALAHRWDQTLRESHVLQLMIELIARQEKEERD